MVTDDTHTVRDLPLPRLQALWHRRRPRAVILQHPSFLSAADLLPHWRADDDRSSRIVALIDATVTDAASRQLPSAPRRILVCVTAGAHNGSSSGHRAQRAAAASASPNAMHVRAGDNDVNSGSCAAIGTGRRGDCPCLHVLALQHVRRRRAYGRQLKVRRRAEHAGWSHSHPGLRQPLGRDGRPPPPNTDDATTANATNDDAWCAANGGAAIVIFSR